jgi:predicted PurR-regulated permease PerM
VTDPRALDTRQLIRFLALLFAAVVVFWLLYAARTAVVLIYISGLLAIGLAPLVRLIEHLEMLPIAAERIPRWLAILILYLLFITVVVVLALLIVPPVVRQALELSQALPAMFERAQDWLVQRGITTRRLAFDEAVPEAGKDAVKTVVTTAWSVAGILIALVTVLIMTFYLLVDAARLHRLILRLVPAERREQAATLGLRIGSRVSAWLVGNVLLGILVGGATAIGLSIIGVPFAWVIAVLAGAAELVPIVGPLIAGTVAVVMGLTVSLKTALITLAFILGLQILESNVLVPKVMQRQVGLSPVVIVAALLIGSELRGVLGAILAIPTAAIVQAIIEELGNYNA